MFGIDSPELLVIAIVALVVIGPKELPGLLRTWGRWMSQMRSMASEFRGHVDEMVRQSELDEVKKQLTGSTPDLDLKSLDPTKQIREHIQEGMAEGDKALAEAKSALENPMAEPDSAPQVGAEASEQAALPASATSENAPETSVAEIRAAETSAGLATEPSTGPSTMVAANAGPPPSVPEEKPTKAAAE